jgi:hypothetical protein
VLPSLKVPVAKNGCMVPAAIDTPGGVTAIEMIVASLTAKVAEPLTVPEIAVTVTLPPAIVVAKPVLLTVTKLTSLEVHVTELVRFCVLLSVNVPVAVNCWVVPTATVRLTGVTAMETNIAPVTVSEADALTVPDVAVTIAVPVLALVPSPWVPAALLIAATAGADELHCTLLVTFCVLPSVNVPVAVNC